MTGAAQGVAVAAAVVNLVVAAWGGILWYRVAAQGRAIWRGVRASQAASVVHALAVGGLYIGGLDPADDLYVLYVGLPIAVSFVAEQLRALSAQTVLDARGLEDAAAVGKLDAAAQQSVVTAILRRELGVMAAACAVATFLLLRAADTV
ncbi:hypothetical protein DSM112329_00685 [Paraconexibacter sp. AEG42_29]|uniref:DUF4149 domain-containing protein n=1 Tax=Paraconexibacter sp. AEG42_29 TaxID=2997339 RepID=A0AAU7AR71_9ACTN